MNTAGIWREISIRIALVVFWVEVLAYISRLLLHKGFYEANYKVMVIGAEIGFLVGIGVAILALIAMRSRFKIPTVIGALILAYLWFSDIAWWVMVK